MKYLKTYELITYHQGVKYPEVILKIYKYLKKIISEELGEKYGEFVTNSIKLEENRKNTYSIVFEGYKNYLIIQFDYKEDGVWIKYLNSSEEPLKSKIDILSDIFNNVTIKRSEYGWNVDENKLLSELDNIDTYINSKKYNL